MDESHKKGSKIDMVDSQGTAYKGRGNTGGSCIGRIAGRGTGGSLGEHSQRSIREEMTDSYRGDGSRDAGGQGI